MMKPISIFLGLLMAAVSIVSNVAWANINASDLRINPVIPGSSVTAGYLTLHNSTNKPKVLTAVTATFAEKVEIHDNIVSDGMVKMQQLMQLEIKPAQTLEFKQGGLHLMIFGATPLKPGQKVSVTLVYQDGTNQIVQGVVTDLIEQSSHHHHHH